MLHTTLIILKRNDEILLGMKKRGFGKGRLNGVGGKVEPDESFEECAIRETQEEIGVKLTKLEHVADIVFDNLYYKGVPERNMMHVYFGLKWEGEPKESDEIEPRWTKISDIDYGKMWCDDEHWYPHVLAGKKVEAWFHFNEDDTYDDFWVDVLPDGYFEEIDDSDVGLADKKVPAEADYVRRPTSRGILLDDKDRVALIHSVNRGWYKLPGGGAEGDELRRETLEREMLEETGYEIEVLQDLGTSRNTRHQWRLDSEAQFYLCRAKKFVGTKPMEDEIEDGDTLEWFDSFDDAIAALESVKLDEIGFYGAYFFTRREIDALKYAKQVYKR
jgi:8-oxo-dGTP pyrophosphatase MutT (NUDIX family)